MDFDDDTANDYRLRDTVVEFRTNKGQWQSLSDFDILKHFLFNAEVAGWLAMQSPDDAELCLLMHPDLQFSTSDRAPDPVRLWQLLFWRGKPISSARRLGVVGILQLKPVGVRVRNLVRRVPWFREKAL